MITLPAMPLLAAEQPTGLEPSRLGHEKCMHACDLFKYDSSRCLDSSCSAYPMACHKACVLRAVHMYVSYLSVLLVENSFPTCVWGGQVGIIRGVEVELQSASKDLQDTAKLEKDKMRKWGKLAEEARAQLAAASPDGAAPVCHIVTERSLKIELEFVIYASAHAGPLNLCSATVLSNDYV